MAALLRWIRKALLPTVVLIAALQLSSCGDSRPVAPDTLPPEQVADADMALIDLIHRKTETLAEKLDQALPNNATREHTVRLRLRVAEIVLRAKQEQNAVVRLVQLWFWALAFQTHMDEHASASYPGQDALLRKSAAEMIQGADTIVRKVLPDPGFGELRQNLLEAATHGDAFYSIQADQGSVLSQLWSATKLQSILSLPLAPFNALNGIGEGAKGLDRLSTVGDKLISMLGDYPQILELQFQLLAVQMQNQDVPRQALKDLDDITKTAADAVHVLPEEIRKQIEILVQNTGPQQQMLRELVDRTTAMAEAMRGLIDASQKLLAEVKPLLPPPAAAGTPPVPASKPLDLKELAASLAALQAATHELRGLVNDTASGITSTHLQDRARMADAAVRDNIDHISLRILELLVFATLFAAALIVLVRLVHRPRHVPPGLHPPLPPAPAAPAPPSGAAALPGEAASQAGLPEATPAQGPGTSER